MSVENRGRQSRESLAWKLNIKLTQGVQKFVYRYASKRLNDDDVVFLNYGYEEDPPMAVPLSAEDEPNRYSIQLYHSTAAQAGIEGKKVLEVGCGHGGGASYLTRTMHPLTYTALDLNTDGIAFCRRKHRVPGLDFVQGDAQALPFPDDTFDCVINVESSHLYPRFAVFLDEVARVLRPGGHFLYTDARSTHAVAEWEADLASAPMRMLSQRSISVAVARGMERNVDKLEDVIDRVSPAMFRGFVASYAPARRAFDDLRAGGLCDYRMYCFVKP